MKRSDPEPIWRRGRSRLRRAGSRSSRSAGQPEEAGKPTRRRNLGRTRSEESEADARRAPTAANFPPVDEFGEPSWPAPRSDEDQFASLGVQHRSSAAPKIQALPPVPVQSAPAEAEAPSEMSIGRRCAARSRTSTRSLPAEAESSRPATFLLVQIGVQPPCGSRARLASLPQIEDQARIAHRIAAEAGGRHAAALEEAFDAPLQLELQSLSPFRISMFMLCSIFEGDFLLV